MSFRLAFRLESKMDGINRVPKLDRLSSCNFKRITKEKLYHVFMLAFRLEDKWMALAKFYDWAI